MSHGLFKVSDAAAILTLQTSYNFSVCVKRFAVMVTTLLKGGSYSALSEMRPQPDIEQCSVPFLESHTNKQIL